MRLFSTILFALMAMVLPMAGVEQYFCTMSMSFVTGSNDCPVNEEKCCGEKGKHEPVTPDCMVSSKLLPNAEKSMQLQIPAFCGWSFLPISAVEIFPNAEIITVSPERDRGPPDDLPRLYLVQRRLLI